MPAVDWRGGPLLGTIPAMSDFLPLPLARDDGRWGYAPLADRGAEGACTLVFRAPATGVALGASLSSALPLLLHEFDRQEGLGSALARFERLGKSALNPSAKTVLRRILPRLGSFRYVESLGMHEFMFEGHRASSVHVLSRLLETKHAFRLEDLSHFATHGEHILAITHAVKLPRSIDPAAILYCPALDGSFPFKFVLTGQGPQSNRAAYVGLLKRLLRQTESDEDFRARNFRELARGFDKFGPASATPEFQTVELRIWRMLTYLAARLRVKAGLLTDATELETVETRLRELHEVHDSLSQLVYLPSRLAARFRNRFDLELSMLAEQTRPELDKIAAQIDLDLDEQQLSVDQIAGLVSEFRRLGSAAPIECLAEVDRQVKLAYGDVEVPALETGWMRTYTATIHTGAQRFDTRRYDAGAGSTLAGVFEESDFSLDLNLNFGFGSDAGDGSEESWEAGEDGDEDALENSGLENSGLEQSAWDDSSDFGSEVEDAWGDEELEGEEAFEE